MTIRIDPTTKTTGTLITEVIYNTELAGNLIYLLAGMTVGDVKASVRTTDIGKFWLVCDGRTVGSGASGATARANDDMEVLFTLLWTNVDNAELTIQDSGGSPTTRGASAAADFAADKRMPLPDLRGRTVIGMDGIANRITDPWADTLAGAGGAGTHTLTTAQLPSHSHGPGGGGNNHIIGVASGGIGGLGAGSNISTAGNTATAGSGNAHNNVQPSMALNWLICTGVLDVA